MTTMKFGARPTGPEFTWGWIENGEYREKVFHGRRSLSFEETLDYAASTQRLNNEALIDRRLTTEQLKEVNKLKGEEALAMLDDLNARSFEGERSRWKLVLEQCVMLIDPTEHDEILPLLDAGDPTEVRGLRDELAKVIIEALHYDVAAVADVDPTSPSSPSDS